MTLAHSSVRAAVGALNSLGGGLSAIGFDLPKLDQESLVRAAIRRAGGLTQFGQWPIEEPLERLIASYRADAHLTTLGRITVREMLISLLENLLYLEHDRLTQPALCNERIEAPVFITGLPRTGTTLLHGLLTEDPDNRVPLTWEVMYPANRSASRQQLPATKRRTAARLDWANRLAPEFRRIHPIAPDLPQECIAITAQVFMSIQFHTTHDVPTYEDWFEANGQRLGYEFHHRFLQHLQHRQSGKRWVLKAPGHLFALADLLARYPDAKIVQTHRDPLRVVASMASLATVLKRAFSDNADPKIIGADWAGRWAHALTSFLEERDRQPAGKFLDVNYDRLEEAPMETVEEVYRFIGAPLSDTARTKMEAFLARNPKNKHGEHHYSLAEYGLDRDAELARFKSYCERFEISVQRS